MRAEDVKLGVSRLKGLQDHNNQHFVGDMVLLGFSHGATAAISAVHDYSRTQVGGVDEMVKWSVKSSGVEYDTTAYEAPLSNQNADVQGAIAYYGGTYGFGYFTDYAPGEGTAYRYHLNKHLMIHHGTDDGTISIGTANKKWTPRGFEHHINQGNHAQDADFHFYEWLDAEHSFDMPSVMGQPNIDARNGARVLTFKFLSEYLGQN